MKFPLLLLTVFFWGCTSSSVNQTKYPEIYLDKNEFKNLDFHTKALIPIFVRGTWYYVRKDGKAMSTLSNKDGSVESFQEGLARTKINGKIGFFNKNLDLVLKPNYDFAFPFHNGMAEICIGCKETIDNGYPLLSGGKWKRIDRQGLLIEE